MKTVFSAVLFFCADALYCQFNAPGDFGFKHLELIYKSDKVDVLIKSQKGEELTQKPIFFFCQGSMPQPLIKYDNEGVYGVFPFSPDSLINKYHLVIVSKPYIPLVADVSTLGSSFTFVDSTGHFPTQYSERNLLDYYVNRNIKIIKYLHKQKWVSSKELVLAGHSEGSTIAAKIASMSPLVTHLIYSGGNPMGRILSMIQQQRLYETDTDSTRFAENEFDYWKFVVDNKTSMDASQGDVPKTTYDFSNPPIDYLEKINIPVLVCYGTKDWSAPYNDYLRVEMIRKQKENFTFNAYIGTEHNYFPVTADNIPDYEIFNWDKVAQDWFNWLNEN